ncbi:hypothetical protein EII29_09835 [Leptotrichia sp. OH3620_COT-345]|uniref:phage tail sheath C-terminal domain-containing protein n=1 Tax=Leptotrichia sp. OH3620_COT-345 TaxID=2491048 RepID=UPI000F648B2C|nr:phage tail sheath C-terminal domain-containing protein [Leptotrichia sp. OH3620_COT-345]RRD38816.1 hypothetical protein EII29_09835 [Leptotrichia sp. OH3620_COT-345]
MNGSPKFVLEIEERAATAIQRSQQGVLGIILFDSTKDEEIYKYANALEVLQADWTDKNFKYLRNLAFVGGPYKVVVRRIKTEERTTINLSKILYELENEVDSFVIPEATEDETDGLISYAKQRHNVETGKLAVDFNQASFFTFVASDKNPDHHAIINNDIDEVTVSGTQYTKSEFALAIASLEAGCSISRSITNMKMGFIEKCKLPENPGTITKAGKITVALQKDDTGLSYYVINRGVTSFVSPTTIKQRRFSKIKVVRTLLMVTEDLKKTWDIYKGARNNNYTQKMALINAINAYTNSLMEQGILDSEYPNEFDIDIAEHKRILMTERNMTREQVDKLSISEIRRINTIDRVYILCEQLMPVDAMEDFYGKAIIRS